MALDAVSFMRTRLRGTPSWPGHDPEAGYVGADRSDHSQKLLADGAGHTFLKAATVSSSLAGFDAEEASCRLSGDLGDRRGTGVRSNVSDGSAPHAIWCRTFPCAGAAWAMARFEAGRSQCVCARNEKVGDI